MKYFKFDCSKKGIDSFINEFVSSFKVSYKKYSSILNSVEELIRMISSYGKKDATNVSVGLDLTESKIIVLMEDDNDELDLNLPINKLSLEVIKKALDEFEYKSNAYRLVKLI